MKMRWLHFFLLSIIFLLPIHLVSAQEPLPEVCSCKYQRALSKAISGACSVRENLGRDCELVWAPPFGSKQVMGEFNRAQLDEIIQDALAAAQGVSDSGFQYPAPKTSSSWKEALGAIEAITVTAPGNPFLQSLALLSDPRLLEKYPQGMLTAIVIITSSGVDPSLRPVVLKAVLSKTELLQQFSPKIGKGVVQSDRLPVEGPKGPGFLIFSVGPGCLDIVVEQFGYAQLIKAGWSRRMGGRCQ
jgi:hypothetical protein